MLPTVTFFVALLSAVSAAPATPAAAPADTQHAFKAPGTNDLRSPCPMLNALANHGFLPRDGRNVSMEQLIAGFKEGTNLDPAATQLVAKVGMGASTTGNNDTINLSDFDNHNGFIEHDGSLSRNDLALGDNHSFNKTIFAQTASFWTTDKITIAQQAKARLARIATAKATNPKFSMTEQQVKGSLLENALILMLFGDGLNGNADKKQVISWFETEKIPYELGFKKPANPITVQMALGMVQKLAAASE
ncbi:hypothetical protein MAPG_04649 [Magnaporthiopsis poae ATCC 64411]|uniref:Heme haloperoxidase family profile domain-containing protein n=1 Tax=Magnaporthiopsis poae (strain ATCC 64411 / 73-15) TaxID=644358 RepID=A0A0C4DXA8_MAGP6|nr:hypothetical protein MAPG_04649 [Magnaporthiopsis poae ATCC 64411]